MVEYNTETPIEDLVQLPDVELTDVLLHPKIINSALHFKNSVVLS